MPVDTHVVLRRRSRRRTLYEQRSRIIDEDRVAGAAKQIKGSVKEAIGKIMGDTKTQAEGAAEKALGKAQSAVGKGKDAIRDATKD